MAEVWKAVPVVEALSQQTDTLVQQAQQAGITPKLAIIRVGEKPSDISYERGSRKRCAARGIDVEVFHLDENTTQEELISTIHTINDDSHIHGCVMLRPLPSHLDEEEACATLLAEKDVDGITLPSLFGVFAQQHVGFSPCTAQAVMETLDFYGAELEGARVVVLGRSMVVGKPVAIMLQAKNATVTMCHSRTTHIQEVCREADIIVAAIGRARLVNADWVRPGQTIIDVGINWDEDEGRLVGDVDYDAVEPIVAAITPVPGGLGSVTSAVLCKHVAQAATASLPDNN